MLVIACSAPLCASRRAEDEELVLKGPGLLARERGLAAAAAGRYAEALPLLERVVSSAPRDTYPSRQAHGVVQNTLGGVYKAVGRVAEATALFEHALSTFHAQEREAPSARDAHVARSESAVVMNNLGSAHAEGGRLDEAGDLYARSLATFESLAEADSSASASAGPADALNNLADLRHTNGRLDEAKLLYERSLALRESTLGPTHDQVASGVNNLAVLLMDMRRSDEALPLLWRAARIARSTLGVKHPQYATALNNLAGGLQQVGRSGEARSRFKRALRIQREAFGADHSSTRNTEANLKAAGGSEDQRDL